ncbi:aminoacyl-histidine dipeptidase [Dysgonomonas sp. 216]|uniref:aminoacyl-histidine dipeptidase n=1 Tax=Dysgonomonas sp. 216 TaxID=2302934 RepID=UPI0013D73EDE|nr:aminoacyl-histidine dipeptidase [Dysgonomonas sp. 216]NDW17693.1 aminoacyl-histidine dipeptidase [Dysgonomonas sp. 216]
MPKNVLSLEPKNVWKHFYDLSQIPRPTGQMKAVTAFVKDFGHSLNLETIQDETGNVLIKKPASKGMENAPVVILQSHLDMVPQKNTSVKHDFEKDPIELRVEGNIVKANSTTLGADNGIGVAAIMAILEDTSLVHAPIEALFTIDEEVGMVGAFGLKQGFLKGSVLLNLDTEEIGDLCVGCAGGVDINVSFGFKDEKTPEGDIAYKISLTGLKGGHSGTEIHLGRANANKLMMRLLKEAVSDFEVRLSSFKGGSLRNAIPREAFAVVTVPKGGEEDLQSLVKEYESTYKAEYNGIEDKLLLVVEKTNLPATVIPEEVQDSLINAVEGCQNGVISMLTDFPGTVESSSNLASIESSAGKIEIKFLARSSSETRKDAICSSIESVFNLAGAKVEIENPYPGWQPNAKAKVLHIMSDLYEEMYSKPAKVNVVHAGLECGIILGSTPGLDIVSFGPTILNAHSPDEYVEIDTVAIFYDYLKATLARLK